MTQRFTLAACALLLATGVFSPARAQVEVEADPIAYVLDGYSGHLAYVFDPIRVSAGVFGVEVPEFFHGNEGWASRSRGVKVKADYLMRNLDGFFVGLDTGYQRATHTLDATDASEDQDLFGLGARTGYRVTFPGTGFYLVPWVSVSYLFNADDVVLDGETFEQSAVQVFPTVHLGWQF